MPVLPAGHARPEQNIDIAIIGAGACGICAALAASEAGAEVMLFERDKSPTGSTALSTGLIPAAGTRLQRELGVDDQPGLFAADIIAKAHGETDAAMAQAIAAESAATVEWLIDTHGVALTLVQGFLYPGHSRLRMHGTPARTGAELESALLAAADRRQLDIVTEAHVTDLYATPEGSVTALAVQRPDGAREIIGCRALILACNGYGGNKAMLREFIPEMADAEYWGHVGNQGDAVNWGIALGAGIADMGSYQGHGAVATPHGRPIMWGIMTGGGIQVNALGTRFSNEVRGYSEQAVEVINQPGGIAWNIYDAAREEPALGFADYIEVNALGGIRRAGSIGELAQLCGLPAAALEATLAQVERQRAGAATDPFGRDFRGTAPFAPPYCAVKVTGALFHTQGGLVVDATARVQRRDGTKLPNLFAGGGAARGLSGPSRWGYLSGNGLLTATVLGRLAGRNAAALLHAAQE